VVPPPGPALADRRPNPLARPPGRPAGGRAAGRTVHVPFPGAGGAAPERVPPASLRRWFARFAPVLAAAARRVYANDGAPLEAKLPAAVRLLVKQINLFDVLRAFGLGLVAGVSEALTLGWNRLRRLMRLRHKPGAPATGRLGHKPGAPATGRPVAGAPGLYQDAKALTGPYADYAAAVNLATDMTPVAAGADQAWEARLAQLAYDSVKASHI